MKTVATLLIAWVALAQAPAFEVASVRPFTGGGLDFRVLPGGRLHVTGATPKSLVEQAYGLQDYQVTGGPSWVDVDRFNIEAKAQGEPTRAQVMEMLRALLTERFELRVRRATTEQNVYALVVGKGGHHLSPPTGDRSFIGLSRKEPPTEQGVHYSLAGKRSTLAQLAQKLAGELLHPVIDRTGIEGEFDFTVDYAIDDKPEAGPPLKIAVQQQLGLRLEPAKGPVETLVIEHAARPSAN